MRALTRRSQAMIVAVSLLLGLLFLYSGVFPWPGSLHDYADFSKGPTHYEISLLVLYGIVVYVSFVFRIRVGVIVAILVTLALVPHQMARLHDIPFFRPISFGAAAVLTAGLIGTVLNRRDLAREAYEVEQGLARQVATVRETEKQSLARELHDVVLQKAVDIVHEIDDLLEDMSKEVNRARLKQLRVDMEEMMDQTRQVVRDLRPPLLDEIGLAASLKGLADSKTEHGVEITLSVRGKEQRLPDLVEAALFRIAEEALNNGRRHSKATLIEMAVEFGADKVWLTISDNGVGFVLPTYRQLVGARKFGIADMAERARLAGGDFRVQSAVGRGTVITVEVPARQGA